MAGEPQRIYAMAVQRIVNEHKVHVSVLEQLADVRSGRRVEEQSGIGALLDIRCEIDAARREIGDAARDSTCALWCPFLA